MRLMNIVFLMCIMSMPLWGNFGGKDDKDRKVYLLSIISNPRSNVEEKTNAELALAEIYLHGEEQLSSNFEEAKKIYNNIIENKRVKSETKNAAKFKLANILANVYQGKFEPSCSDYVQAIALFNEVIADSKFDMTTKRWAQCTLAGLYIGCYGTLPLLDVSRAKELLLQVLGNKIIGNDEVHSKAQLMLANILSGAYNYPMPFLVDKEPCDFNQAIILYDAVIATRYTYKQDRTEAHWQLLKLYLKGPADIQSLEKAQKHSNYLLGKNSDLNLIDQWWVKMYMLQYILSKADATELEVQQAVREYYELLKDPCIDEREREIGLFELKQFQQKSK